jgi:hypothetical protein
MFNARALAVRLVQLLSRERDAMAEFLVALADFDRQRAWAELGYSSLFWFLHRELGISKGAAHYRKIAVELVQNHPEVLSPLRDGRLCLTSVIELSKVLTAENSLDVLPRYFGLSRREAAEVTASIRPVEKPAVRDVVTGISTAQPAAMPPNAPRDNPVVVQPREPLLRVTPVPTTLTVPLTEDLRRLHITVSRRFLAKVDAARGALSHSNPRATVESILEAGLDLLVARHRKRRGIGVAPSAGGRKAATGRISADTKREVWARDDGKCQWALDGGGLCGSTVRLEFDHVIPRGRGGTSEPSNLRLLCRFHNQYVARQVYGDDLMDRFAARVPRASEPVAGWRCRAAAYPRRRNFAITRFSPMPGKATVTLASGPAPSQRRTSPSPRLGWVTRSPEVNAGRSSSGL